jgi:hypothetical protein
MKLKETTCRCEICRVEFTYVTSSRPRKTCSRSCRLEMRLRDGGFQFHTVATDPCPDEIARRARIIREINEENKRLENGRPMILKHQLDWY